MSKYIKILVVFLAYLAAAPFLALFRFLDFVSDDEFSRVCLKILNDK